jgi:hypothetical protein
MLPAAEIAQFLFRKAADPALARWLEKLGKPVESATGDLVRHLAYPRLGIEVLFQREDRLLPRELAKDPEAWRVVAIRMYAQGHEGFAEFGGALPEGLRFDEPQPAVARRLGPPDETGGGLRSPPWDAWIRERYRLVVQYDRPREHVELVTLALPRGGGS